MTNRMPVSKIEFGAGPVGLRTAVEAALLGAKVDVLEKRTTFSRNNVLKLWQFMIADLKKIGAKKLYTRFCFGTTEHISESLYYTQYDFKGGWGLRPPIEK